MARTGRPKAELVISDDERKQLLRWSRRATSAQALALPSKIVLACAEGADNKTVAGRLGCAPATVGKWRARFVAHRLDGLTDEPRSGRPPLIAVEQVEDVVVATLEQTRRTPRIGRGRRWPSGRACPRARSGGSGRPSTSSRTGPTPSSCRRTRCSWTSSTTSVTLATSSGSVENLNVCQQPARPVRHPQPLRRWGQRCDDDPVTVDRAGPPRPGCIVETGHPALFVPAPRVITVCRLTPSRSAISV